MKIKRSFAISVEKLRFFTYRDSHNNSGVESHCSECLEIWFEWQNRAVQREMEKWIEYNSYKFSVKRHLHLKS